MNTNVLASLASLVLGSSSVALAAPAFTVPAQGSYETTVVRDHRGGWDPAVVQRPAQPEDHMVYSPPWRPESRPVMRPVTLASGLRFNRSGRMEIAVGNKLGRFGSLQISAAGGRTFIQQVTVQFENGRTQVLRHLNRTLTGSETLTLDLDGDRRAIRSVVVYGKPINSGWRPSASAFTLTAV